MRIAIIDLGTNTFNILIVSIKRNAQFEVLLNTKSAVMLGQEGINEGYISDKAFARAYAVLRDFSDLISQFRCEKIVAMGTSAIRSASNSDAFITKIASDLNIHIQPISGEQEAEYIYYGVINAVPFTDENYLILDIGGGSNEFVIANKHSIYWKQSFKLGGARLLDKFKPSDPITTKEISQINGYLMEELKPLFQAIEKYPITKLVGSSGAFDTFAEMLHVKQAGIPLSKVVIQNSLSINNFNAIYYQLIETDRQNRLLIPGMETIRVDTIVMAAIFTKFVTDNTPVNGIIRSAYALKEGVASQLLTNL